MVGVSSLACSTLILRLSSSLSTSEPNQSRVQCRWGRTLRDMHKSECAHFVSKWCPTMNLATECAEMLQEEYLTLCWNESITDVRFIKWLIYVQTRVKGQHSHQLALEWKNKDWDFTKVYASGTDINECFHEWFGLDRYKICWKLRLWKLENLKFTWSEILGHL